MAALDFKDNLYLKNGGDPDPIWKVRGAYNPNGRAIPVSITDVALSEESVLIKLRGATVDQITLTAYTYANSDGTKDITTVDDIPDY